MSERRAAFVSSVTHALRTPLTTFRLYAGLLEEGMVPAAEVPTYHATRRREADRLTHLVGNVLAYARQMGGDLAYEPPADRGARFVLTLPLVPTAEVVRP